MSQPDDFDRSMDRLGNSMEKNVDKAVNAMEKGANVDRVLKHLLSRKSNQSMWRNE